MPYIWEKTGISQPLNQAFTRNGVQYGRSWIISASEEERTAIGLEWIDDDRPRKDERYYRVSGGRGDWTVTPIDLDDAKASDIAHVKKNAAARLAPTDWLVVRKMESGAAIPDDITEFRAATRAYSNTAEAAINACEDVDALAALKTEWPKSPEELKRDAEMEAARAEAEARAKAKEEERAAGGES